VVVAQKFHTGIFSGEQRPMMMLVVRGEDKTMMNSGVWSRMQTIRIARLGG
jgi:hypothetical protein